MLRITVAFIVVTLTGLPVLPAMCHAWCGSKTTSEYCHDEAVGNGSATLITERAGCRAIVTDYWFIRENARPALHAVQHLPAARTASVLTTAAAHSFSALHQSTVLASPAPPLVLRV